ncbi:MAG: SH3 domain-containing protein [Lachnospiraceae bacterium]|nr:SH3 domain-containing protein [Lachnospiraceae bacterium]
MQKRRIIISLLIMTGLAIAACGKSDKASETEAAEENAELQTIEFDTGAEEPVETAVVEEPVEEEPIVIEETPTPEEDIEITETVEEPAAQPETASSDYSVEDMGETVLYTTDTVNMRMGPSSTDFDVAEKLSVGTKVTANGKVNGYKGDGKTWYRIKRSDGSTVFIIAEYLSDKKPEEKEKTEDTAQNNKSASDDAAKKAAEDAAKKAAEDAAKKAAEENPQTVTPATPAPAATPVADAPKNGHKYPDSKIAADWDRTGANSAGRKWAELDEGTKEALRIHYDDHGCAGW